MTVELRVQPRSRRNALVALPDGRWKLHLTAPAIAGRANDAAIEFFARALRIPRCRVRLLAGEKSRDKVVAIEGVSEEQFRALAAEVSGSSPRAAGLRLY